jgi:hypothetical protein
MIVSEDKGVYCIRNDKRDIKCYIDCSGEQFLKADKTKYCTAHIPFLKSGIHYYGKEQDIIFITNILFLLLTKSYLNIAHYLPIIEKVSKLGILFSTVFASSHTVFAILRSNTKQFINLIVSLNQKKVFVESVLFENQAYFYSDSTLKRILELNLPLDMNPKYATPYFFSLVEKNGTDVMKKIGTASFLKMVNSVEQICEETNTKPPSPSHFYSEALKIIDYDEKIKKTKLEKSTQGKTFLEDWSYDKYGCYVLKDKNDFLVEGRLNRNCVGTYYDKNDDPSKLYCSIRMKDNMDKPLITAELFYIDTNTPVINQFLGTCNENPAAFVEDVGEMKRSLLNFIIEHNKQ